MAEVTNGLLQVFKLPRRSIQFPGAVAALEIVECQDVGPRVEQLPIPAAALCVAGLHGSRNISLVLLKLQIRLLVFGESSKGELCRQVLEASTMNRSSRG